MATRSSTDGIIIHHTAGSTLSGALNTFKKTGKSSHYIVDRDGTIHQLKDNDAVAGHTLPSGSNKGSSKYEVKAPGLSNRNTIGIEVVGRDNGDITPEQIRATTELAKSLSNQYGLDPSSQVYGHGEVTPGHRQISEGMAIVSALRGYAPLVVSEKQYEQMVGGPAGWNAGNMGFGGDATADAASSGPTLPAPPASIGGIGSRTLKQGRKGADVKALNQTLAALGYDADPNSEVFDAKTKAAVEKYQENTGLNVDGKVGPKTRDYITPTYEQLKAEGAIGGQGVGPDAAVDNFGVLDPSSNFGQMVSTEFAGTPDVQQIADLAQQIRQQPRMRPGLLTPDEMAVGQPWQNSARYPASNAPIESPIPTSRPDLMGAVGSYADEAGRPIPRMSGLLGDVAAEALPDTDAVRAQRDLVAKEIEDRAAEVENAIYEMEMARARAEMPRSVPTTSVAGDYTDDVIGAMDGPARPSYATSGYDPRQEQYDNQRDLEARLAFDKSFSALKLAEMSDPGGFRLQRAIEEDAARKQQMSDYGPTFGADELGTTRIENGAGLLGPTAPDGRPAPTLGTYNPETYAEMSRDPRFADMGSGLLSNPSAAAASAAEGFADPYARNIAKERLRGLLDPESVSSNSGGLFNTVGPALNAVGGAGRAVGDWFSGPLREPSVGSLFSTRADFAPATPATPRGAGARQYNAIGSNPSWPSGSLTYSKDAVRTYGGTMSPSQMKGIAASVRQSPQSAPSGTFTGTSAAFGSIPTFDFDLAGWTPANAANTYTVQAPNAAAAATGVPNPGQPTTVGPKPAYFNANAPQPGLLGKVGGGLGGPVGAVVGFLLGKRLQQGQMYGGGGGGGGLLGGLFGGGFDSEAAARNAAYAASAIGGPNMVGGNYGKATYGVRGSDGVVRGTTESGTGYESYTDERGRRTHTVGGKTYKEAPSGKGYARVF